MSETTPSAETPKGPSLRADMLSGFLVFLIALPLCLAIAQASGFPPIAGIWTAVAGGLICTFISNSEMTIKGPAAGLIVIVAGAVSDLPKEFAASEDPLFGYKLALGIGVAAGVMQVLLGLMRAGKLVDFFPLTPVHGMLAAIGLIVIATQTYAVMGVDRPRAEPGHEPPTPLGLLFNLPHAARGANPEILAIGFVSLVILFGLPLLARAVKGLKLIPAQLIVLVIAVALGFYFDLEHEHKYPFPPTGEEYFVGPKFLVAIPNVIKDGLASAFVLPDFRAVATLTGLKYLLLFTLIGSLESVLSAKAIDLLDPLKRRTDFNKDLLAIGVANALVALVGGLPMISEIVRSSANINNGARSRFANLWHGVFLLAFVLLFPQVIHSIPLAALGAMLVYTGFRLASPNEFVKTYLVGVEQLAVFLTTIVVTLATDLLIGITAGIALKVALHLWHGAPLSGLLRPAVEAKPEGDGRVVLSVRGAAVFSNWISLRSSVMLGAENATDVVLDLSGTRLVDHSVMEKLHELESDLALQGKHMTVIGLDGHKALSAHPRAARRKVAMG